MVDKLKTYFRLLRLYARMDIQWLTQDTGACLTTIFCDMVGAISSIGGVLLLAVRFGGVGGMSADQVLLMLGLYTLVQGLCTLFFDGNNVSNISRRIGRGQLDHMIIQPQPLLVQLLTEGFMPASGSGILLGGIGVTIVAICRLSIVITPLWLLTLMTCLLCALAILLGLSYLFATSAFYQPTGSEEISGLALYTTLALAPYPLSTLPVLGQLFLTTVLPAGCIAWLPARILLGDIPAITLAWLPLLAALICGTATLLFRKGLKHYVQKGCSRYRSMGYRS